MKNLFLSSRLWCIILCLFGMMLPSYSQTTVEEVVIENEASVPSNPIVEMIEQNEAIEYYEIPDDIIKNLLTNPSNLKRPHVGTGVKKSNPVVSKKGPAPSIMKVQGYRIQVFSDGRNPSTLQSRAKARGNAIVARFPKYRGQVYTFSSSPNWYTRVGNFESQKDAAAALAELKRAFPAFAAEMRVVKSPITVIH